MEKFINFYYKYVVKIPTLYFLFIIVGISTFLYFLFNTDVALIQTFEGIYAEDRLIINEAVDYPIEKVYAYQNRSDKIITYEIDDAEIIDDSYTVLYISKYDLSKTLEGTIKIDVEKQKISVINIIFGLQKRYIEEQ